MQEPETNPFASPRCIAKASGIHYQRDETVFGTWKSFQHENGKTFREFCSHARSGELPLFHFTSGQCPETNRSRTAVGMIAVGRFARGFFAFGQVSVGVVAVGQASFGLLMGAGQLAVGISAVGQLAIGQQAFGQFPIDQSKLSQLVSLFF